MVAPNKHHIEAYNVAYELEEFIIQKLEPGTKIADVYDAGVKWLEKKKPDMMENMTKSFGWVLLLKRAAQQVTVEFFRRSATVRGIRFREQ